MEALLKVRLDLKLNNSPTDSFDKFYMNHDDAFAVINSMGGLSSGTNHNKIKDFIVNSYMINPAELFMMDIPAELKISIIDESIKIAIIEIEMGVSRRDDPIASEQSSFIPKHTIALSAARQKLKDTVSDITVIIVKDNYTKTRSVFTDPKLTTNPIGAKYRLFLDNVMISERLYPYEIMPNDILEENVIVDILPGKHEVRLENISNHNVIITDLKFDDQIIRDVNADSCSFEFN